MTVALAKNDPFRFPMLGHFRINATHHWGPHICHSTWGANKLHAARAKASENMHPPGWRNLHQRQQSSVMTRALKGLNMPSYLLAYPQCWGNHSWWSSCRRQITPLFWWAVRGIREETFKNHRPTINALSCVIWPITCNLWSSWSWWLHIPWPSLSLVLVQWLFCTTTALLPIHGSIFCNHWHFHSSAPSFFVLSFPFHLCTASSISAFSPWFSPLYWIAYQEAHRP